MKKHIIYLLAVFMSACTGGTKLSDETYEETMAKCYVFDRQLMTNACLAGGKEHAELCTCFIRLLEMKLNKNNAK